MIWIMSESLGSLHWLKGYYNSSCLFDVKYEWSWSITLAKVVRVMPIIPGWWTTIFALEFCHLLYSCKSIVKAQRPIMVGHKTN